MDLVKEAIFLGFSGAAVMDTKELVFVPEYRTFCEENLCGCYNVNPACPPESGTAEEMKQRALQYEKTLVLQTMQEDMHDSVQYKKDKLLQNKMTEELAEKMNKFKPEGLSIVDTFGAMYEEDLLRIAKILDAGLEKEIRLGFHFAYSENSLSFFGT